MLQVWLMFWVKHQDVTMVFRGGGVEEYSVRFCLFLAALLLKQSAALSSLYGMFLCVELGDPPPPGQDFMGPYLNTAPLLYDCRFDMTKKTPPS